MEGFYMSLNVNFNSQINNSTVKKTQNINFGNKKTATQSSDVLVINGKNKKELSKTNKIILALGATTLATIIGLITHRHIKINKSIKAIDAKFDKLKENLPEAQKVFKEVFMRNNLNEKETLEILEGYRMIEKKGVKLSKEKYAKEVFEFSKKNFEIHNQKMEILFEPKNLANACCFRSNSKIYLTPKGLSKEKNEIFETLHHELRHAKQNELMYHRKPSCLDYSVAQELMHNKFSDMSEYMNYCKNIREKTGAKKEFDKIFLDEIDKDFHFRDLIKKNYGEPKPENVPEEAKDFVDKLISQQHSTIHYECRAEEIDAFATGEKIKNLIFN